MKIEIDTDDYEMKDFLEYYSSLGKDSFYRERLNSYLLKKIKEQSPKYPKVGEVWEDGEGREQLIIFDIRNKIGFFNDDIEHISYCLIAIDGSKNIHRFLSNGKFTKEQQETDIKFNLIKKIKDADCN